MTAEQKAATAATSSTAAKPTPEQGTEWIICRVCGYIEEAKYRDQPCPTCGFPPTVWMDYKPRRINPTREKLLDLHLHPIAVHFPIAATAASFLVPVIALLIPSIANVLFSAITLVAMILPLHFILSCVQAYIAIADGVNADNAWIMIILGIVASIFAAKLGKMGSYLFAGRFSPYTAG